MSRFALAIVGYGRDPHARCFEDFARSMKAVLVDLGHEVVPHTEAWPRERATIEARLIVFGFQNVKDPGALLPPDAIFYNTEQTAAVTNAKDIVRAHETFKERIVWDYSRANAEALRTIGFERIIDCPVGYHSSMWRREILSAREEDKDIDVLFYGSVNARRQRVLDGLRARGLRVMELFGIYGEERDAAIARSKIVLNLHFYPGGVFEIFRVSHLLANCVCVVSEAGGCDGGLEAFAAEATCYVAYDKIVDACCDLSEHSEKRNLIAQRGHETFSQTLLTDSVRLALEHS